MPLQSESTELIFKSYGASQHHQRPAMLALWVCLPWLTELAWCWCATLEAYLCTGRLPLSCVCIKSILRMRQRFTPLACTLCGIVGDPCRASATCTASAGAAVQTTLCRQRCTPVRHWRKVQVPLKYKQPLAPKVTILSEET